MLTVIQVVTHASVKVNDTIIGAIDQGILALIGIEKTDTQATAEKLFNKIINYRVFADDDGKTNLNLQQIQGGLLLVPQFTLVADTEKGTRPGFSRGMPPEEGQQLFDYLIQHAGEHFPLVAAGEFGAYMQISLCNDGPATYLLSCT